jgi:hypothetical protein
MLLKKKLTEYNRYQAFAVHMAISLVIFFILSLCITQYWYPGILFDTDNGWKAIGMIIGIDLILGPLLTIIVFNPKKSSLKFDLSIIALIQVAALIYGSWTIHQTRPVALAFINSSFSTIYANSALAKALGHNIEEYNTNKFYYLFEEFTTSKELNADQFKPYNDYSEIVGQMTSPYRERHFSPIKEDSNSLFRLDPLSSATKYIEIENESGSIIQFVKQ